MGFSYIYNLLKEENDAPIDEMPPPLFDTSDDDKSVQAIKRGQDHSADDKSNFWNQLVEKFRAIPANLLAPLLGISEESVSKIPHLVEEALEKAEKSSKETDDKNHPERPRNDMLSTGRHNTGDAGKMGVADGAGWNKYT